MKVKNEFGIVCRDQTTEFHLHRICKEMSWDLKSPAISVVFYIYGINMRYLRARGSERYLRCGPCFLRYLEFICSSESRLEKDFRSPQGTVEEVWYVCKA